MFQIILAYEAFKNRLSETVHLTQAGLHLVLGILLTIGLGWLLRLPLGSWRPLLIVFAIEMVNEAFDFTRYHVSHYPWTPWPALCDIAITILPPLFIVLAARWNSPDFYRFKRRSQSRPDMSVGVSEPPGV